MKKTASLGGTMRTLKRLGLTACLAGMLLSPPTAAPAAPTWIGAIGAGQDSNGDSFEIVARTTGANKGVLLYAGARNEIVLECVKFASWPAGRPVSLFIRGETKTGRKWVARFDRAPVVGDPRLWRADRVQFRDYNGGSVGPCGIGALLPQPLLAGTVIGIPG